MLLHNTQDQCFIAHETNSLMGMISHDSHTHNYVSMRVFNSQVRPGMLVPIITLRRDSGELKSEAVPVSKRHPAIEHRETCNNRRLGGKVI